MIATIILLVILLILAVLVIPFTRQIVKDKQELAISPINEKFRIIADILNDTLLDGMGELVLFDSEPRQMNLFSDERSNMLIVFYYSTGHLTITLKYKYLQNEMVFQKQFFDLRNLSVYRQRDIANEFIELSLQKMHEHQQEVGYNDVCSMSGTRTQNNSPNDPTNILTKMFDNMSYGEKCSAINFLYLIGKADGSNDKRILESPGFSQQILAMNVKWEDCMRQLTTFGEDKIYNDLASLDKSIVIMLALSGMQIVVNLSNQPMVLNPIHERCFFKSFERIGYSRKDIENELEKFMLLSQTYLG